MGEITKYIAAKGHEASHLLFLPTLILDLFVMFSLEHREELALSFFILEMRLGVTRKGENRGMGLELQALSRDDEALQYHIHGACVP